MFPEPEAASNDTTPNFLFRLAEDFGRKGFRYRQGYRWNRLFHRREFYKPVTIIPVELSYGIIYLGGGGTEGRELRSDFLQFEQAVSGINGGPWTARLGQQVELDLLKTNLSQIIFKTSWLDIHTGINLRYMMLFTPPSVPSTQWGSVNPAWDVGSKSLAPRILEAGISNSINLQWYDKWYLTTRYQFGYATAKFYKSGNAMDSEPSGWGPSVIYSIGFRYILDPGMANRFTVGLDLKHGYTKINHIDDPNDVTPINRMDISNFGIFLTLSAFYGGQATIGEAAKDHFFHKNYIQAKNLFQDFVTEYPTHANVYRANRYIDECNRLIPEQLMREGLSFDDRKMTDKALEKYQQAMEKSRDSVLTGALEERIRQIATARLRDAQDQLNAGDPKTALAIVQEVAGYYEPAKKEVPRFQAQVTLVEGERLLETGFYFKAINYFDQAVKQDPELEAEVNLLRYQTAIKLVEEANSVDDRSAIQLAIHSLETARELTGGLGQQSEDVLKELKKRITQLDEQRAQQKINARMDDLRRLRAERSRAQLAIGMTIPQVQDILGQPREVVHKPARHGKDAQLWIYPLDNGDNLECSFLDFRLFKVEQTSGRQ